MRDHENPERSSWFDWVIITQCVPSVRTSFESAFVDCFVHIEFCHSEGMNWAEMGCEVFRLFRGSCKDPIWLRFFVADNLLCQNSELCLSTSILVSTLYEIIIPVARPWNSSKPGFLPNRQHLEFLGKSLWGTQVSAPWSQRAVQQKSTTLTDSQITMRSCRRCVDWSVIHGLKIN